MAYRQVGPIYVHFLLFKKVVGAAYIHVRSIVRKLR